MSKEEYLGL